MNPEAYEAYLRGSSHVDRLTRPDLDVALQYFEQAIEKDPSDARAWVGVYRVWATRQQLVPALRREADQPRRAALQRRWRWTARCPRSMPQWPARPSPIGIGTQPISATAAPSISIQASPSHVRSTRSTLNQMKRPDEAMLQIQRAIELDPLNPAVQTLYGLALNNANRPEDAIVQFQRVLRTTPDSAVALTGLQGALTRLGRTDEVLKLQEKRAMARGDGELEDAFGRDGDGAAVSSATRSPPSRPARIQGSWSTKCRLRCCTFDSRNSIGRWTGWSAPTSRITPTCLASTTAGRSIHSVRSRVFKRCCGG